MVDQAKNKEFISRRVKAIEESVRFFSPQAKEQRERWVVERFLFFILPCTQASEIQWVDAEPWDVLSIGAKFQIKEIQEPGRRRHKEFKEALGEAKVATHPFDLFEQYTPTEITAAHAVAMVLAQLPGWTEKYAPEVVEILDLLVYLNIEHSVSTDILPDLSGDTNLSKWNTVSVVCNDCAFILSARQGAPIFLSKTVGRVRRSSI